jgi:hypothetical protein
MINNDVNCGGFIYCTTHWGPHEKKKFHNVGNGLWHQYMFFIDGELEVEFRDTEDGEITSSINTREYDVNGVDFDKRLVDCLQRSKYETMITKHEGSTVMFFNPISETRLLKINVFKEGTYQVGSDKRISIICIQKEMYANGNRMVPMQYATVWPGKKAEIVIPENAICAAVTYSDDLDQMIEHMYK